MSEYIAGPELDELVAEHVLGWKRPTREFEPWDTRPVEFPGCCFVSRGGVPRFSRDVTAAWQVVEKMRCADEAPAERYWEFRDCASLGWRADYRGVLTENDAPADISHGLGETLPLAICRAALEAFPTPSPGRTP